MNLNATLLGQTITFVVFLYFCWKFIWPPIVQAMRERQAAIAEGLAASERAEKNLEEAKAAVDEQLNEAKQQATEIIEQARARASQMVEEAKSDAREEGARMLETARAEIEQETNRVKESLRAQVATLALSGAEKVLGETVDAEKHAALLNQLAAEL
ncbi:MAG: F0F1 ATP synthase subunit B [Pseudomonadota bacterium]